MEQKALEKKMRIQLYDKEMNQISDRLVAQDLELTKGPKEPHKGSLRIEFSLFAESDIDLCVSYLQKLSGQLPVEAPKVRAKKVKIDNTKDKAEVFADMKNDGDYFGDKEKFFEEIVNKLRESDYVIISYDMIQLLGLPLEVSVEAHKEAYFLIRRIKRAKNPLNDKYDPTIMFGISAEDTKQLTRPFHVYIYGKFVETLSFTKKKSTFRIKDKESLKFPPFMVENERIRFSKEHRELLNASEDETKTFSDFYQRWAPYVTGSLKIG